MSQWKAILTKNGVELGEVEIKRGLFEGDVLTIFHHCSDPSHTHT